jgi:hypothetical protein
MPAPTYIERRRCNKNLHGVCGYRVESGKTIIQFSLSRSLRFRASKLYLCAGDLPPVAVQITEEKGSLVDIGLDLLEVYGTFPPEFS